MEFFSLIPRPHLAGQGLGTRLDFGPFHEHFVPIKTTNHMAIL